MRLRPLGTTALVAALAATGIAFTSGTAAARPTASASLDAAVNLQFTGNRGGLNAVGLTDGGKKLVVFKVDRPSRFTAGAAITGLAGDTHLVGIDHRVQNGRLYGVGNLGGLYLISDKAAASKVGQLSAALSGTSFGVDFNPAANALRIVSDTGQNLRQPFGPADAPNGDTVTDTALTNAGAPALGVTAAAYTNNDLSPDTATTLFDLDTVVDQVVLQSPANSGALVATGKFGVAADPDAGFDIYSKVRKDRAVEVTGYATLGVNGAYKLYEIDLLTGVAEAKGSFSAPVTDIAIPLGQR